MVVTQHPAAPGQGALVECVGLLLLVKRAQIGGEPTGRGEGVGWSSSTRRRRVRVSSTDNFMIGGPMPAPCLHADCDQAVINSRDLLVR
jgi:hypothetical protein